MHSRLCICALIEPMALATRVVVLTHRAEAGKTTNTGRLVPLTLTNAELRVRGVKGHPLDTSDLVVPQRLSLLLYPAADSVPLSREIVGERSVTLIVLDGNWGQAARMGRRETALAEAERVCLPPGPPSRYRLRTHDDPSRVATFEAVARALGILEGAEVQARMERVFEVMVERTLWTRGDLGASQVSGGIPPRS